MNWGIARATATPINAHIILNTISYHTKYYQYYPYKTQAARLQYTRIWHRFINSALWTNSTNTNPTQVIELINGSLWCPESVAQRQNVGLGIERSRVWNSLVPSWFSLRQRNKSALLGGPVRWECRALSTIRLQFLHGCQTFFMYDTVISEDIISCLRKCFENGQKNHVHVQSWQNHHYPLWLNIPF